MLLITQSIDEDIIYSTEVPVSEEDRDIVRQQIQKTYAKFQNMEFEKGCGEGESCRMHDLNPPLSEMNEDGVA